ncbi:SdrD B-like domain-containing protein, partial [Ruania rhizosphaerae]|uniref:SdrD B-like domain-containing protein n=1 Tax=Ruania rhizosphaerae TaxID=1840413 RepID=UPI00190F7E15
MKLRRMLAAGAACALTGGLLAAGVAPAVAAPTDGSITVMVVEDRNVDSVRDAEDLPLESVQVRFVDAAGDAITRNTDASGVVTLLPADNSLAGGQYRVEVQNPDTGSYTEAQILDGHAEPEFAPAVSFVDVADGQDATLSVGYVDPSRLGPDGATVFSAIQPDDVWPEPSELREMYSIDYALTQSKLAELTARHTLGSVYGIGIDQTEMDLYVGAYAKRGSLYGSEGPGALYRVNALTGEDELYATVDDAGTTEHDIDAVNPEGHELQDFAFRTAVGRESLGDVDVTEDDSYVTVVNMNTDSLVVYPVQEATNPAPIQTLAVPAPLDCTADWAPMALEEHDGVLYVGAICGATLQAHLLTYERAADGTLTATGTTYEGDVTTTPGREDQSAELQFAGGVCSSAEWFAWSDDLPQECLDVAPFNAPINPSAVEISAQYSAAQPMLADIEITDAGQFILSFRDRMSDQHGSILYMGERTNGDAAYANNVVAGDIVAVELDEAAGTIDFTARDDFEDRARQHYESGFSGIVHVDGTDRVVSNLMDANGAAWNNGLRAFDPQTGDMISPSSGGSGILVSEDFQKGQGLADLEALVLEQTQQIGNRVWMDTDEDGIQDPDEAPVEGVQVSLYDDAGVLVATTETDENGEYWFDTADGLLPETDYQVRLDREADFQSGGPLAGTSPTDDDAGFNEDIDSNGVAADPDSGLGDHVVLAEITSPDPGENDHSIDFGFVPPEFVSVGDYVWIDEDRDGIQDEGETPVEGVTVTLLDENEDVVGTTVTDEDGYYVFTDLPISTDYTIEFPTTVVVDGQDYPLTQTGAGEDEGVDSNPDQGTGQFSFT